MKPRTDESTGRRWKHAAIVAAVLVYLGLLMSNRIYPEGEKIASLPNWRRNCVEINSVPPDSEEVCLTTSELLLNGTAVPSSNWTIDVTRQQIKRLQFLSGRRGIRTRGPHFKGRLTQETQKLTRSPTKEQS